MARLNTAAGARSVRITRLGVADGTRYRGTSVRRMRANYLPAGTWTVFARSAAPPGTRSCTMHRMGHCVTGECANVRRAQELVDSHSDDVYIKPPMDCEKYKTSKIMYNKNISWIYLIIGKYFWVRRLRFILWDRS